MNQEQIIKIKTYEIQIEIENRCYLNCCHCSSWSSRNLPSKIFQPEELERFIRLFDVPLHIYFTGGEPLLYPNILPLIKFVKNISPNIDVGIFTCGVLKNVTEIDKIYASKLKECGLDDCYISLYHYKPEKHDLITSQRGSYDETIKSIYNLLENRIDVKVHLVINNYNYQELDKIIIETIKLGVNHVRLLRIVKHGLAEKNWDSIGVPYKRQNTAIKEIINNIKKYNGTVSVAGFPNEVACRPSPNSIKCQAGTHLLCITNSKNVYPCACTKNSSAFLLCSINDTANIEQYLNKQRDVFCNENCLNPIIF